MRYVTIIFLSLLTACGSGQNGKEQNPPDKFGVFKFYQNDTIKVRLSEIVRTDSTYNDATGYSIRKSFDKSDTLVQELKFLLFQSDTRRAYLTRNLYDRNGQIVIYELFNMEGRLLEGIKYEYDDKGLMIKKEEINTDNN